MLLKVHRTRNLCNPSWLHDRVRPLWRLSTANCDWFIVPPIYSSTPLANFDGIVQLLAKVSWVDRKHQPWFRCVVEEHPLLRFSQETRHVRAELELTYRTTVSVPGPHGKRRQQSILGRNFSKFLKLPGELGALTSQVVDIVKIQN